MTLVARGERIGREPAPCGRPRRQRRHGNASARKSPPLSPPQPKASSAPAAAASRCSLHEGSRKQRTSLSYSGEKYLDFFLL